MSSETKGSKTRQSRAILRDSVILDSAQEILADSGWRTLSLLSTADAAGVSRKSLHSRYKNKNDLAISLWHERLFLPLKVTLTKSMESAGLFGVPGSKAELEKSLLACAKPSQALFASLELLIISQFEKDIRDAIQKSLIEEISLWLTPKTGTVSKALAAKRAYVIALSLGYMLAARFPRDKKLINVSATATNLFEAIGEDRKPSTLPKVTFQHFYESIDFGTGDLALESLFNSVLKKVGELGFEGASINAIVEDAGYTEGLLFSRYKSKLELFLAATHAAGVAGLKKSDDAMKKVQTQSKQPVGIAEAIFMREYLKPGIERKRALHLEKLRVSWGIPTLLEAQVQEVEGFIESAKKDRKYWGGADAFNYIHAAYAMGVGLSLLGTLNAQAYLLPLDVVTAPVEERLRRGK